MKGIRLNTVIVMGSILSALSMNGQATFVQKEFCKRSEVELMTNCQIPENYVIVGSSTFLKSDQVTSLQDLSNRQASQMRAFARRMKSCHVLVDFSGDLIPTVDKNGTPVSDTHSAYYVLQPSFEAETKKAE